jgi:hypothetical protein
MANHGTAVEAGDGTAITVVAGPTRDRITDKRSAGTLTRAHVVLHMPDLWKTARRERHTAR